MRLRYLIPIVAVVIVLLAVPPERVIAWHTGDFGYKLAAAAVERTRSVVIYDPAYRNLSYPWGDVKPNRGVCTDVVVRAYRDLGFDLQQLVKKGIGGDPNITHRRVRNLRQFFARYGQSLPISKNPDDYKPGDLVTYVRPNGVTHIVVVVGRRSWDGKRPLVVHNEGYGPKLDDALFDYRMTGHYRYIPPGARRRG